MRKSYVFVYSNSLGTRDEIKNCIDNMSEVIHWRYDMDQCFYLVSENSADDLAEKIRNNLGKNERFLIVEKTSNSQGWLPSETWTLLNDKRRE